MAKLGVWRIDEPRPEQEKLRVAPQPVPRSNVGLEKDFEQWIANDVTLIGEGLTIVGRQISIDKGRLDLLAIDSQDRWVVIEIKPGMLVPDALTQAFGYASSIARLDAGDLRRMVKSRLAELRNHEELSARVEQQLESEGEEREIAVLLVGAGVHPALDRTTDFLRRFRVPIRIVSFEVFELEGGPKLLVREVVEEQVEPSAPPRRLTVEAIRQSAIDQGVVGQFDRFVEMSRDADLAVQPQRNSVRIAPPANRTRFLMYASPHNGGIRIYTGPPQFAEFFPPLTEEEVTKALGPDSDGGFLTGSALDARLDRIETFLKEKLPRAEIAGDQP